MLRALTAFAFTLSTMIAATAGEKGMASHYSTRDKNQTGSKTASGRPLRDHELTAAHRSLPFGSKVRVTGSNGRSVVVTITDRGPFRFVLTRQRFRTQPLAAPVSGTVIDKAA